MTTNDVAGRNVKPRASASDIMLDGLFTGMIGALVVAVWFLVLDLAAGQPLRTPALLGNVLLHGTMGAGIITVTPLQVAAYSAFHFVAFIAVGVFLSYMMTLFERFPIMFFVLDAILGAQMMNQLKPWTVVVGNLLAAAAMALFLWKRHPSVLGSVERLWEDNQ